MKTVFAPGLVSHLSVLAVVLCTGVRVRAVNPPSAPSPDSKTHVLFVGADLSVENDKKLYHVENVAGDSFIVTIDKHPFAFRRTKITSRLRSTSICS